MLRHIRGYAALAALLTLVLAATPSATAQQYKDNVVILLDASGSMGQRMGSSKMTRIEAAKAALKQALAQIPDSTDVGLLTFNENERRAWVYALGPRDNATLDQAINGLKVGGGTPLGRFLKVAADRLLEVRKDQFGYGSYRLLVLTDGEANDASAVDRYVPEILARGITMDVIGVDMAQAHTLATKVHSYRRADDSAALEKAISEVLAEVSVSTGDGDAAADFELLEGLPMEIAGAMLDALARPDNRPIGTAAAPSRAAQTTQTAPVRVPGVPSPGPVAPMQSMPSGKQGSGMGKIMTIMVVGFVAVTILRVLAGARRGRR